MQFDESQISKRFRNGCLLIRSGTANPGFKYMIVDKNSNPVIDEYFGNVILLTDNSFEVFNADSSESGILEMGESVNWDIKTPTEIKREARVALKRLIAEKIENVAPYCFCAYPRILDYIENRPSEDSRIIEVAFMHSLIETRRRFDKQESLHKTSYKCGTCGSQYVHHYRERSKDKLILISLAVKENIGKEPSEWAPNYLSALSRKIFFRIYEDWKKKWKFYRADLEEFSEYLFQVNPNSSKD